MRYLTTSRSTNSGLPLGQGSEYRMIQRATCGAAIAASLMLSLGCGSPPPDAPAEPAVLGSFTDTRSTAAHRSSLPQPGNSSLIRPVYPLLTPHEDNIQPGSQPGDHQPTGEQSAVAYWTEPQDGEDLPTAIAPMVYQATDYQAEEAFAQELWQEQFLHEVAD